jgi:hypothetical protein
LEKFGFRKSLIWKRLMNYGNFGKNGVRIFFAEVFRVPEAGDFFGGEAGRSGFGYPGETAAPAERGCGGSLPKEPPRRDRTGGNGSKLVLLS